MPLLDEFGVSNTLLLDDSLFDSQATLPLSIFQICSERHSASRSARATAALMHNIADRIACLAGASQHVVRQFSQTFATF